MLCECLVKRVCAFITDFVNVQVIVMGAYGEEFLTRRVTSCLTPLLGLLKTCDLVVEVIEATNGDLASVAADNDVVVSC